MRLMLLLLLASLAAVALAACGSDSGLDSVDTPTPVPTVAPSPTPQPTATSMFVPTPTAQPAPTASQPEQTGSSQATGERELKGTPIEGGVLMLLGSEPPTLDPHQTGDATSSRYILEVFGGLLTIDPDLAIVPDIARSWEIDPDGMGYTFRLNDTVTFHDGRSVTSADVQWSLERASAPETQAPAVDTFLGDIVGVKAKLDGEADSISGITVIDDSTIRMEIDGPKTYFLSKMTYPTSFVIDQANVESGRDWVKTPNGTGPFKLVEYDPGVLIRLERFDDYHLGPAMLDAVEFNLAGGDGLLMYENDELHLGRVGIAGLEIFRDPTHPLHNQFHQGPPEFDVYYIGMNTSEPPFDDVNVRLALNYAVDRETIAEVLLEGAGVPARGILPPGFPGYNSQLDVYEFNPDRARELLAQSKYGADTANYPPMTMTLPGSFGSSTDPLTEVILATWEEQLGIRVDLLQTEWATFLEDLRDERFQIFGGLGWIADYPDPENFLDVLFHTGSDNNHTHYSDPQLDALLERARVEQDQTARFEMYQEAERMLLQGAPWVPLYHSTGDHYLIKPYVKGLPLSPLVIPRFRFVYFIE